MPSGIRCFLFRAVVFKLGFIGGDAGDAGDAPGETFFKKFPPNPLPKSLGHGKAFVDCSAVQGSFSFNGQENASFIICLKGF